MRVFNILSLVFLIVYIASCADKPIKKKIKKVENEDFKLKVNYFYNEKLDFHPLENVKLDDALVTESFSRLNKQQVFRFEDAKVPLRQMNSLCYRGKYWLAFNIADKLFKKWRGNPIYWNQIGVCFFLKKEFYKAKLYFLNANDAYKKAGGKDEYYVPSYHNLGLLYLKQGDYEAAYSVFEKVISMKKNSKVAAFNLSQLLLKFGLVKESTELLNKIDNQKDPDIIGALAAAHFFNGEIDKAINAYQKLPKYYLEKKNYGLNYSLALLKKNRLSDSVKVFDKIDAFKGDELNNYYKRVEKYMNKQKKILNEKRMRAKQ